MEISGCGDLSVPGDLTKKKEREERGGSEGGGEENQAKI